MKSSKKGGITGLVETDMDEYGKLVICSFKENKIVKEAFNQELIQFELIFIADKVSSDIIPQDVVFSAVGLVFQNEVKFYLCHVYDELTLHSCFPEELYEDFKLNWHLRGHKT